MFIHRGLIKSFNSRSNSWKHDTFPRRVCLFFGISDYYYNANISKITLTAISCTWIFVRNIFHIIFFDLLMYYLIILCPCTIIILLRSIPQWSFDNKPDIWGRRNVNQIQKCIHANEARGLPLFLLPSAS